MSSDLTLLPAELGPRVEAGFTRRAGGTSQGAWSGLDLGLHVGDDPERVAANRHLLAERMGAPVWFARQVHGTRSLVVGAGSSPDPDPFRADLGADDGGYDALVTADRGVALGVLVADCVPVLLADPQAAVVAVAHAGRVGLLTGVLSSVLTAMRQLGARPERINAALGPSAGPCCYEVPRRMHDEACAVLPAIGARTTWGTPSLDLRAGCRAVLSEAGVARVQDVGGCTIEDEQGYSYRRCPVTGRFAGVVKMVG